MKEETAKKMMDILMNATVGEVEDTHGTVKLLSYEKLRDGKVVEGWKVLRCEVRPESRITDKSKCISYAIDLLWDYDADVAYRLLEKYKEVNEGDEIGLDAILGDVREALKQFNIKLDLI